MLVSHANNILHCCHALNTQNYLIYSSILNIKLEVTDHIQPNPTCSLIIKFLIVVCVAVAGLLVCSLITFNARFAISVRLKRRNFTGNAKARIKTEKSISNKAAFRCIYTECKLRHNVVTFILWLQLPNDMRLMF